MDDIKMAEWVQWLEGCVRTLFEVGPVAIAMFARLPGGESMTAYYTATPRKRPWPRTTSTPTPCSTWF